MTTRGELEEELRGEVLFGGWQGCHLGAVIGLRILHFNPSFRTNFALLYYSKMSKTRRFSYNIQYFNEV